MRSNCEIIGQALRDTPEADKAERMAYAGEYLVPTEIARRLERERDEARAELADWQDSAKNVRKEYEDEQHCSCVPILRKLLKDAERERDEARGMAEEADAAHDMAIADLARCEKSVDTLVQRATELIGRWDSPSWKEAGPTARFIEKLREAVASYEGHSRSEAPKKPRPLPPIDARYNVATKAPKRKKRKAKVLCR